MFLIQYAVIAMTMMSPQLVHAFIGSNHHHQPLLFSPAKDLVTTRNGLVSSPSPSSYSSLRDDSSTLLTMVLALPKTIQNPPCDISISGVNEVNGINETELASMSTSSRNLASEKKKTKKLAIKASALLLLVATAAVVTLKSTVGLSAVGKTSTVISSFIKKFLSRTGSFYEALSLVFLSEIGDKTFFMAALLAMKTSRFVSFVGSFSALAAMTILSVMVGQIFHAFPLTGIAGGVPIDKYAAVVAFTFFGIMTLKEAKTIGSSSGSSSSSSSSSSDDHTAVVSGGMDEELAEAEETIKESNAITKKTTIWAQIVSTFSLVFAAEFGDRSMLATIALGAAQNPFGVAWGAITAHGLTTLIAVCGGSYVSKHVSERNVNTLSGVLFLVFAATTALGIF